MGKLKELMIVAQEIIETEVQNGWDEAVDTIQNAKDETHDNIILSLTELANKHNLEFEDLEELFQNSLTDDIENTIDYVWEL